MTNSALTAGTYYGVPAAEYHKIEALSASGAKLLLRSPAHYLASKANPREPTANMKFGTLVHTLVLEPELVATEIAVSPKFDKRTTIGKQAAAEFEIRAEGKMVIDEDLFAKAQRVADAVRAHPVVKDELLPDGNTEVTMLWNQHGLPCKGRVDYMRGATMMDVKTCQDASPDGFARSVATFSYHMQAAHYAAGFKEIVGWDLDRFIFIAVESESPHGVGIYTLDARSLASGRKMIERAALAYHRAVSMADTWKGYDEQIVELSVPSWAQVEAFSG